MASIAWYLGTFYTKSGGSSFLVPTRTVWGLDMTASHLKDWQSFSQKMLESPF
ncbi:MAG: hypothetical protein Q8Q54_13365 [Methylococcales bacterium]|nr:hypothetical protein [Methylococcales bacterium]MDP3839901.1 hypothetical protein [Methylococcales bacterium]